MTDEQAIQSVLDARAQATRSKDAQATARAFANDAVNFDLAPPLAQRADVIKDPERLRQWFSTWDGPIGIELSDLTVRVADQIAFAFGLLHMVGKRTDGEHTNVWARSTVCLEKRDGAWKIIHEHTSFPTRMDGSERSATDLKPDRG